MRTVITTMILLAAVGPATGTVSARAAPQGVRSADMCRVVDGDTLRCGKERVRLLGIDAPELPGHCTRGRTCAPGDPIASSESLSLALALPVRIERIGTDRFGRTLALVSSSKGDLSCWQLRRGQATYRRDWDTGGRLARICPAARRR